MLKFIEGFCFISDCCEVWMIEAWETKSGFKTQKTIHHFAKISYCGIRANNDLRLSFF